MSAAPPGPSWSFTFLYPPDTARRCFLQLYRPRLVTTSICAAIVLAWAALAVRDPVLRWFSGFGIGVLTVVGATWLRLWRRTGVSAAELSSGPLEAAVDAEGVRIRAEHWSYDLRYPAVRRVLRTRDFVLLDRGAGVNPFPLPLAALGSDAASYLERRVAESRGAAPVA